MTLDNQRQETRRKERDLKIRMEIISSKPESDRTEEERRTYALFEERRQKKNKRSRERTKERKAELMRITGMPEAQRSEEEKVWLEVFLKAKRRKNEGDRMRRERIKKRGLRAAAAASYEEPYSDMDNEEATRSKIAPATVTAATGTTATK